MKLFRWLLGLMLVLTRRGKERGFYQCGFVVIDLDSIRKNPNIQSPLELVRYCEWVLRHEIGHALKPEYSTEGFAEWFAERYKK